ncbi:hypothetical protein PHYBOEH_005065 [Phytophthora boehmeriae]|uniref:Uncharacterized protein n=1 Tax=Phytophthora boehmeriae TaxID=109152 RepID=A0A8T1WKC4_9STRA|nr:hypothetical protein PHYBOEH_005065 [Phytophthora boehmeriae]
MDLSEIPFDIIILHSSHKSKNLINSPGSKNARCLRDNRDVYEQLILRRVREDKVAIQSARTGRFLRVRTNGECVFDPKEPGEQELFTMETDADCHLFFVSCHTGNVLQCDDTNVAKCVNKNRLLWEFWRIVEPRATATTIATPINQRGPDLGQTLAGTERQHFILELAKCNMKADEIEQIVTRLFDVPVATADTVIEKSCSA